MDAELLGQLEEERRAREAFIKEIPKAPLLGAIAPKLIVSILDELEQRCGSPSMNNARELWRRISMGGSVAVYEWKMARYALTRALDAYDVTPEETWTSQERAQWLALWATHQAAFGKKTKRELKSILWSATECVAWSNTRDHEPRAAWSIELQRTYHKYRQLLVELKEEGAL
jgi:hypothetical protein